MSIWNTQEDIEKRREAYTWTSPFETYDAELERVREARRKVKKTSISKERRQESYSFLIKERDSIYHRIDIADAVSNSMSVSFIKKLTAAMKREMLNLASDIAVDVESMGYEIKSEIMSDEEKMQSKKTFILHLIGRIRRSVSNADSVTEKEMLGISEDIQRLVLLYWSNAMTVSKNVPLYPDASKTIIDFFRSETGYSATVCRCCNSVTTDFFDKCLNCGKNLSE